MLRMDQTVGSSVTNASLVTVSGVTWTSFVCSHAFGYVSHGGVGSLSTGSPSGRVAHARVNSQAKAFMSAWTAVIPNSFGMFLIVMQWISHCVQWQIDSVGVFVWALAPFCGFCFVSAVCSLFPLAKRKSGWGICGSSFLVWLWFSFLLLQSICRLQGPFVLAQCISSLLSCKDRAFSATSATLEEKKVTQRSRFWQKHLGLMYSQATVRSYTRDRAVLRWDHTLKRGRL